MAEARAERFDPIFVTDEDLQDLATFTGLPHDKCLERLRDYSTEELADSWRRANPTTPEAIGDFYRTTPLYVWELMQWHASPARIPYTRALEAFTARFPPEAGYRHVLDFGAGVGTDALFLSARGYHVTLVDVEGETLRFARHRFSRRGLTADVQVSRSPLPQPVGIFDVVVCFDVFEHLSDPLAAAARLTAALRPGGLFLQRASFYDEGEHPCHLSDNVDRFAGRRWHVEMTGLGLRSRGLMLYQRSSGAERLALLARYALWQATGLWVERIPRG